MAGGVPGAVIALIATTAVWSLMVTVVVVRAITVVDDVLTASAVAAYILLTTVLGFATLMHLLARLGAAVRFRRHRPVPLDAARASVREREPSLTVLVPSYREEPVVIFRTLLSAALLEFPDTRVVLLIDDPPAPADPGNVALLEGARELPNVVERLLEPMRERVERSFRAFLRGGASDLDGCLAAASAELRTWADFWEDDHGDHLFADLVPRRLAQEFDRLRARRVRTREVEESGYRALLDVFTARVTSFERKRYRNLSHEPNKAMNLNSYLSVMGGRFADEDGLLQRSPDGEISFDDSDFVLTLDADSVLRPDYALRLVALMLEPDHRRVAVAQTPYSAFPGATRTLERVAGATTDIQYLLHQGMTHFGATFWVGANAVLRKRALDEIARTTVEEGRPITRYIRDRTVIEDTESSLDLLLGGWTLLNYPERLAFSATPPDFGSLVIQRRRWATGGLNILPRLGELLARRSRTGERQSLPGLLLQFHYLTSMPMAALALILLLLLPTWMLSGVVPLWIVPLVVVPYLIVQAADLRRNGYRASDVLRVFALNMLLLPVNLAGGVHSLRHALTGTKSPFVRTPKIIDRVMVPPTYLVFPSVLAVQGAIMSAVVIVATGSALAAYAAVTAVLTLYGLVALVGVREAVTDVAMGLKSSRRRRRPTPAPAATGLDDAAGDVVPGRA